jgi:hypothetical protein
LGNARGLDDICQANGIALDLGVHNSRGLPEMMERPQDADARVDVYGHPLWDSASASMRRECEHAGYARARNLPVTVSPRSAQDRRVAFANESFSGGFASYWGFPSVEFPDRTEE